MDPQYDVCFAGEILEGQELTAVRLNLAKLFNADEATLDKLFSEKTQVLKSGCDRETALKYKMAIERAGAKPIIRSNSAAQVEAPAPQANAESADNPPHDDGGIDLAPAGADVLRPEERAVEVERDIDTSEIELMETGVDLSDGGEDAPPAPDTSHLTMGEVGEDIPTLPSTTEPVTPDLSGIALSPEHTDFTDCAPAAAEAPVLDLSGLDLAPGGVDLLDAAYKTSEAAVAPDTDHLQLEDDNAT